jgi:Family of unknown function (DUF5343)
MLSPSYWWGLRKRFNQSMPGTVTASYLATIFGTKEDSARKNISIYLKDLGIVDDEGKPSERARRWRDNSQYGEVCQEILEQIYPQELLHAAPNPSEERAPAERWFANHTGAGESAVRKMANLYALLREADFSKEPQPRPDQKSKTVRRPTGGGAARKSSKAVEQRANGGERIVDSGDSSRSITLPEISINLQIHISSDATSDQIDQIFSSMAKHIYNKVT